VTVLPDPGDGRVAVRIADVAADRVATVTHLADGRTEIRERHLDGTVTFRARDRIRRIGTATSPRAERATPGVLGLAATPDSVEVTAPEARVDLAGLPFAPGRADGACALSGGDASARVVTTRAGVVTLHPGVGNSAPGADAGADVEPAPVGTYLRLDGTASCDRDGDALTYRWEMVAAPEGSGWWLGGADTARPWIATDRPGPYRLRLVVTDRAGAPSRADDVTVFAGPRCTGDRLAWSDPRC
jgi:hypothetical protein